MSETKKATKQSGYFITAKLWIGADTTDPISMGVATDKVRAISDMLHKDVKVLDYSAKFQMRREIEDEQASE